MLYVNYWDSWDIKCNFKLSISIRWNICKCALPVIETNLEKQEWVAKLVPGA